jgi:hypothetical protein
MKRLSVIIPALVLTIQTSIFAQNEEAAYTYPSKPVSKGYYSIGDHAKKLARRDFVQPDTVLFRHPVKGYFSINAKPGTAVKSWQQRKESRRTSITKGYYSIGNNAD